MAEELQTKRIIDLAQKTGPEAGDNLAVDNATSGTRRITWANLLDGNLADDNKAAPAGVTGQAIEDAKTTFTDTGDGNIAVNYDEDEPAGTEVPLQSIRFPLLSYKYMVPQITTNLTEQGKAADAKVVGDRFSKVESGVNANSNGIKQIIAGNNWVIPYDIPWKQGFLQPNGLVLQQSYSVYTDTKISTSGAILAYDTTVYKITIMGYDAATDVQATANTGFITISPINLYAIMHKPFVSFVVRRVDGEDFSPEDINDDITVIYTFENTLATKNYVSNKINAIDEEFVQKSVGKNLFNKNASDIIDGYYVGYNDGKAYTNAQYCYLIMKCLPDTDYAVSNNYIHVSIFDGVPVLTTGSNHVGGIVTSASLKTFHTPINGTYMAISLPLTSLNLLQIEYGTTPTAYEPYSVGVDGNEINDGTVSAEKLSFDLDNPVTNIITVKKDGTGDFDTLRGALESISNATSQNLYVVEIYEGIYDVSTEYTPEEWAVESIDFIGLSVPDFVTLKGVGNKENIVITAEDTTQRTYVSTLNLRNTCSLYNLTIKGKNLRYVIHDDYAQAGQNHYVRIVENCDFIGENLRLAYVYGCGIKQGAEYHIRNCRFTTDLVSNFSFLMHNNINWSREAFVEIENCRFLPYETSFGCLFASMSIGAKLTYVTLKGNKMKKLRLNENSPSQYGAGIVFKVTGYGNEIDSADIVNSDGVDYSSYIDLI